MELGIKIFLIIFVALVSFAGIMLVKNETVAIIIFLAWCYMLVMIVLLDTFCDAIIKYLKRVIK
jgi:hypothetical protein